MPVAIVSYFGKSRTKPGFSMIAIIGMGVVVYAAGPEVDQVGCYNQQNGKRQDPKLVFVPDLLGNQSTHANGKDDDRNGAVMVFFIAMSQRVYAYGKGQEDHKIFKRLIFNNVYA